MLLVACPILGFLILAETAIPIYGLAIFNAGFRNLFHAVCVPLKIFWSLDFIEPPSGIYWWGVKVIIFWQPHLGLGHLSCSFNMLPWEFKSVNAEFDIVEQCLFLHLPFLIKSSRVIYLEKIWLLTLPQILHSPFIIFTSFLVLGLTFSNTFWFNVWP